MLFPKNFPAVNSTAEPCRALQSPAEPCRALQILALIRLLQALLTTITLE